MKIHICYFVIYSFLSNNHEGLELSSRFLTYQVKNFHAKILPTWPEILPWQIALKADPQNLFSNTSRLCMCREQDTFLECFLIAEINVSIRIVQVVRTCKKKFLCLVLCQTCVLFFVKHLFCFVGEMGHVFVFRMRFPRAIVLFTKIITFVCQEQLFYLPKALVLFVIGNNSFVSQIIDRCFHFRQTNYNVVSFFTVPLGDFHASRIIHHRQSYVVSTVFNLCVHFLS